jgi:signal transduction histidine kinase
MSTTLPVPTGLSTLQREVIPAQMRMACIISYPLAAGSRTRYRLSTAYAFSFFHFMSNGGDRSDFLRVLRHDLRTPINHVIGYSELLLEDLDDGDEALFRDDLLKILGSGRELLALVNESLSVNEAEIGPSDLERMGTQLRSPLNAIIGYSELILSLIHI